LKLDDLGIAAPAVNCGKSSRHFTRFLQAGASGSQNALRTPSRRPSRSVLVNFQVQQNGNAVRVVDADGSVYDGSLLPESAVGAKRAGSAAAPAPPVTTPAQVERAKTKRQPG